MALDTTTPRSRRALLAAGLGGAAATVAAALGRPAPVRANDGDPVVLGAANSATVLTEIATTSSTVLWCHTQSGIGIDGLERLVLRSLRPQRLILRCLRT